MIDIVYQATGKHAWCIRDGWVNTARRLGLLNRVFEPRAAWGASDTVDDDGLFAYLGNPSADVIILLGFDWHSQPLHSADRWKERWTTSPITKVLYVHESIDNNCRLFGNESMKLSARSAAECVDVIVCPDPVDVAWFKSFTDKPVHFQPYGVDEHMFENRTPFERRKPRPFFRGNTTPYNSASSYAERRALIAHVTKLRLVDLLPFDHTDASVGRFVEDYNAYQIAVAFPSLSIVHSTRAFEALACGCALVTCVTGRPEQDALFQHGVHALAYRNAAELGYYLTSLMKDRAKATQLARQGREHVLGGMTIAHRLNEILQWCGSNRHGRATIATVVPNRVEKSIVVDGVMFQLHRARPFGIARVWQCLLQQLANSSLASRIVVLDRDNTAPRFKGLRYKSAPLFDFARFRDDPLTVQRLCDEENAALFLSTYYTWPEHTPSALMIHDMIPEVRGMDLNEPQWQAKLHAIENAFAHFFVSESTRRDFCLLHPDHIKRPGYLTLNAVAEEYHPRSMTEVESFRSKFGITKRYFLLTGMRTLYKNAMLFFRAFQHLENKADFEIVCTGRELESVFMPFVRGTTVHALSLSDEDLAAAYSGAIALAYPSQYEGFGLPILEAHQCGCPVITCRNSSIPEVAGDAALYVGENDVAAMRTALIDVQKPEVRSTLVELGLVNARRFSWQQTGKVFEAALAELLRLAEQQPQRRPAHITSAHRLSVWLATRNASTELVSAIRFLADAFSPRAAPVEQRALVTAENAVQTSLYPHVAEFGNDLPPPEECDGPLSYVLGLAFQGRKHMGQALQRYQLCMARVLTYGPAFRRQVGLRTAEAALAAGHSVFARDALQKLVLSFAPNDPAALALMARASRNTATAATPRSFAPTGAKA